MDQKGKSASSATSEALKAGIGRFKQGMLIEGTRQFDFVLRAATTDDLIAAEEEAPAEKQIAFNRALLAIQLERVGTFTGPFVASMLGKLSDGDFWRLRKAQLELQEEGEG